MQSGGGPGKSDGQYRGQGSQGKGQGQYQGQGLDKGQGDWNDRAQRPMQPGDDTRPAQPSGTSPLDKDEQLVNQKRPVTQNR
jgi:hypothetical protein